MMIKVFTTNKDGKIELTADELKAILDEAYWEGYRSNSRTYTYNTPNWPFNNITCKTADSQTVTLSSDVTAANCSCGGKCHDAE